MKKNIKNNNIINIVLSIIAIISIFITIALIIDRINTNKSLDKIIYKAKKEAEQTLASTGRMIYAEDVENYVGVSIARPLSDENLPENTEANPQPEGTIVMAKDGWNIETVTAVSVGGGEHNPHT